MLPFQGQGGAQCIEDGAALQAVFSNFVQTDRKSLEDRLEVFERIRRDRASLIQMISNAARDEAEKVTESVLLYAPDGFKLPSE
jgi:salicylate hydroxylase